MAKLTLSNITSGYLPITTVNANWDLIETALENTLSRDGTSPNTMGANLDMNSYDILNVDAISSASLSLGGVLVTAATTLSSTNASIVTNIANLKALAVPTTDITVVVRGYYSSGDGGGGIYYWNALDTTAGNNGTVVVCTANGAAAGRFNLLFN